ncbi:hypothetical protein OGAPHI_006664 [Ogataea philodendri]|uniref:Uncharacterized protein n=1 Tax=Ogataea philodendri TaxID=1378263 RepID=A0A9P8NXZ4_9ASCO|nr:uncharacterized protein OGAPHI_006664 [Ogataea philodendri]KAH3661257.1 hypothetical protein OGAPHI_006664 [Ogataea philodendri]
MSSADFTVVSTGFPGDDSSELGSSVFFGSVGDRFGILDVELDFFKKAGLELWLMASVSSQSGLWRFFRLEFGFLCILECLVSSSDLENLLKQPGKLHWWGFSPVCVLMCLVWCSSLWNALSHMGHLYGRGRSLGGIFFLKLPFALVFCAAGVTADPLPELFSDAVPEEDELSTSDEPVSTVSKGVFKARLVAILNVV